MPIEAKNGKIIVRNNQGELVQIKPETDAGNVAYGNSTVQSALESVADTIADAVENSSAKKVYAEIDPHDETQIEEIHLQPTGIIAASSDSAGSTLDVSFSLLLFGHSGNDEVQMAIGSNDSYGDIWLGRFHTEDGTVLAESDQYVAEYDEYTHSPITASANERYYFDFTIDDSDLVVEGLNAMVSGCQFILEDGSSEYRGNTISITGSGYNPFSEYDTYANGMLGTSIQFSLPEAGQSTTLYFNTWHIFSPNWNEGNIKNRTKTLTFENLGGASYRVSFYWDTSENYEVTTNTRWKELKTTLERQDGTTVVENRPISGLLQDVSAYTETKFSIENMPHTDSYYPVVYVSDAVAEEGEYDH